MTDNQDRDLMDLSETYCYTYEVTMVVQVVAANKEIADARLEKEGGYVSKREVKFIDSIFLFKDIKEEKTEETDK